MYGRFQTHKDAANVSHSLGIEVADFNNIYSEIYKTEGVVSQIKWHPCPGQKFTTSALQRKGAGNVFNNELGLTLDHI